MWWKQWSTHISKRYCLYSCNVPQRVSEMEKHNVLSFSSNDDMLQGTVKKQTNKPKWKAVIEQTRQGIWRLTSIVIMPHAGLFVASTVSYVKYKERYCDIHMVSFANVEWMEGYQTLLLSTTLTVRMYLCNKRNQKPCKNQFSENDERKS